ncbi:hypothetical protein XccvBFoX7_gp36c [Xanthomonas phage FoX7]|nr:hypothetical protein XccvBFoX6_gp36c [Xanthomonas phage FoX6]QJB22193.1 hypothetical protein XccvBFoX7_gp36c [Xanthomonas phage FoX7]
MAIAELLIKLVGESVKGRLLRAALIGTIVATTQAVVPTDDVALPVGKAIRDQIEQPSSSP